MSTFTIPRGGARAARTTLLLSFVLLGAARADAQSEKRSADTIVDDLSPLSIVSEYVALWTKVDLTPYYSEELYDYFGKHRRLGSWIGAHVRREPRLIVADSQRAGITVDLIDSASTTHCYIYLNRIDNLWKISATSCQYSFNRSNDVKHWMLDTLESFEGWPVDDPVRIRMRLAALDDGALKRHWQLHEQEFRTLLQLVWKKGQEEISIAVEQFTDPHYGVPIDSAMAPVGPLMQRVTIASIRRNDRFRFPRDIYYFIIAHVNGETGFLFVPPDAVTPVMGPDRTISTPFHYEQSFEHKLVEEIAPGWYLYRR